MIGWILKLTHAELFSFISAITALVAVIISPLLQWHIAKRQAIDNVSLKRQNWIDELRKEVAKFLTQISRLQELKRPAKNLSIEDKKLNFNEESVAHLLACEFGIIIMLRLNQKEELHNEFKKLIESLMTICKDPSPNETKEQSISDINKFIIERDKVIKQLQLIIKQEWDRIKNGK